MKTTFNSILLAFATIFFASQFANAQNYGNLLVEVDDGDLFVVGEDDDIVNIYISATTTAGRFVLSDPIGLTTFNGQAAITVNDVFGDIEFDLGKGRNFLILDDGPAGDFEVAGNLKITSQSESQSIIMIDDADIEGQTTINTKNGRDVVWFVETDVEQLKVNTGNGDDVFYSNGDTADFNSTIQLKMGKGNDAVLFASNTRVLDELKLQLGNGDDLLGFYDTAVNAPAILNGNGGIDMMGTDLTVFALAPELKSIEFANVLIGEIFDDAYQNNLSFQDANYLYSEFSLGL
jgi:hypothetical protein